MRTAFVLDFHPASLFAKAAEPARGGHRQAVHLSGENDFRESLTGFLPLVVRSGTRLHGPAGLFLRRHHGATLTDILAMTHAWIPLPPLSRAVADGETPTIFCTADLLAEKKEGSWSSPALPPRRGRRSSACRTIPGCRSRGAGRLRNAWLTVSRWRCARTR